MKVTFLLDEFPVFGKFPPIISAMARLRAYGVRFHLFVQNLGQLKEIYGDAGFSALLGNIGCVQYFGGTNDQFTAKTISDLCGKETRVGVSLNVGPGPNSGGNSYHSFERPLLMPDEIMRFKLPSQLVMVTGQNVCAGALIDPSLADFPDYLTFNAWIAAGWNPDKARAAALAQRPAPANHHLPKTSGVSALLSRLFRRTG